MKYAEIVEWSNDISIGCSFFCTKKGAADTEERSRIGEYQMHD